MTEAGHGSGSADAAIAGDRPRADRPVAARWPGTARSRRWLIGLPPLLFFTLSAVTAPQILADPAQHVPGGQDAVLFSWYFEWVLRAVQHGHNPFVSGYLNAPPGVNVMWNTAVLPLAALCAPFTLAFGPVAVVSVLLVFAPAVSATSAYVVFGRITRRWTASAVGALMYGYSTYHHGHYGHLHLALTMFEPVIVYVGWTLLFGRLRRPIALGVVLGVTVAVQLLLAEELVALTAIGAVPAVVFLVITYRREFVGRIRAILVVVGIGAAVTVVLVAVPLYFQFRGAQALRTFTPPFQVRTDVDTLVRPSGISYFATTSDIRAVRIFAPYVAESTGYLGWPLIIGCILATLWWMVRRQRFAFWWAPTTAMLVLLEFGTPIQFEGRRIITGPWALAEHLPLVGGALPGRISLLVALAVAGLIVFTLARLRGWWLVAGTVLALALLVPMTPRLPYYSFRPATPPTFFTTTAVRQIPQGAITVILPQSRFPDTRGMQWQIDSGMRFALVGGYSVFRDPVSGRSTFAPDIPPFVNALTAVGATGRAPDAATLAVMRASVRSSGVRDIVITRVQRNLGVVTAAAAAATGCTPRPVADALLCAVPTP